MTILIFWSRKAELRKTKGIESEERRRIIEKTL